MNLRDDPAEKYLPEFKPPPYGWSALFDGAQREFEEERPRVTLRELASHLAGFYMPFVSETLFKFPHRHWP